MSVTLDVSKLTGWLKFIASCRVEGGGHATWGEVCARAGRWGSHRAWGSGGRKRRAHAEDSRLWRTGVRATEGARAERTANMLSMFLTPAVFQLEMSVLKLLRSWKR